jgi:hypothetical protein
MAVASTIDWGEMKSNIIAVLCVSIIPFCFGLLGAVFNLIEKENIPVKTFNVSKVLNRSLMLVSVLFLVLIFFVFTPR